MKARKIILVRHEKTEGAAALNGHTDAAVLPQRQQARAEKLAERYPDISFVITSPLSRCSGLAKRVSGALNVPCRAVPELAEVSFGEFDGIPFDDLSQHWPVLERYWQDPANNTLPGAESLSQFHERVSRGFRQVLDAEEALTVVVTHGGVIRMLVAHVLGLDWQNPALYSRLAIANGSETHLEYYPGDEDVIRVLSVGEVKD